MSEVEALGDEGVPAEVEGPEGGVAGEVEASQPEPVAEPEVTYDFLEVEDPTTKYVKVKIDGEDQVVPLSEALNGYSRESVSTQRFQQASEMQKQAQDALRLQQAFQANPGLTVQVLASQAGMPVEQFLGLTPAQQQQAVADNQEDEYLDPLERALNEERQARIALEQRIEQREADERLMRSVQGLKQQFQIDDDQAREVVGTALQMGMGPEMFPMIYQSIAYQKQQAAQQAQNMSAEQVQAENARRQAAAQAAAATVGQGSGAVNTTMAVPQDGRMSLQDAILSAMDGQGL